MFFTEKTYTTLIERSAVHFVALVAFVTFATMEPYDRLLSLSDLLNDSFGSLSYEWRGPELSFAASDTELSPMVMAETRVLTSVPS